MPDFDQGNWKELIVQYGSEYGIKVLGALVILFIGKYAVKFLAGVLTRALQKANVDESLTKFIVSLASIGLRLFVYMAALSNLGVETTSFVAVLGAAGLAVGLALQGTLSNFSAGVMIILFKPFKVNDVIDAAGVVGKVDEIGIFATTLLTPDNKVMIVPNGAITGGNITNYTANDTRRVDIVFGIGYDDDLKKAKALIEQIVKAHPAVLAEPEPVVAVSELADSSVNFVVRPWTKTDDYWTVWFDLHEQLKLACDEAGISIPFPQTDVHLHQVPPAA